MSEPGPGDEERWVETMVKQKKRDTDIPGFIIECSAEECEVAGAFVEEALSASDALDSVDEEVI